MKRIICPPGKQVSASLREQGSPVNTPCGGRGNCGKCKVKVIEGHLPVMLMDKVHLTDEELQNGVRLACQAMPKEEVVVEMISTIKTALSDGDSMRKSHQS